MKEMQTSNPQEAGDPQPLGRLLTANPLKHLVIKAQRIRAINEVLQHALPSDLAPHCRTMSLKADTLTIEVDSSAWATRLRYLIPDLKYQLRDFTATADVESVHCRVRPAAQTEPPARKNTPHLSQTSASVIRSAAESISSPALKAALLRLADAPNHSR